MSKMFFSDDGFSLNKVYNSNCIEGMKYMPDKSIDMILCDLPYGTTQNKWDSIIPLRELWQEYNRIIKDNGAIVLTAAQPFTSVLITSNLKYFKYTWCWEKSLKTNFLNARKQPLRTHEDIVVFYKKQCTYNPQGLRIGFITGGNGHTGSYGKWKKKENNQQFTGYPSSILKIPNPNQGSIHPTQKPVALFEYLVKTYTNEGDVVLDNAIGSGTTAIACMNTNRNFIGFEIDKNYFEFANKRIIEITNKGINNL